MSKSEMRKINLDASNQAINSEDKKRRSPLMEELYAIIEEKKYPHLISWALNESSFIISDPSGFAETVLPLLCNHSNFSSFVRQLNMYYFKKRKISISNEAVSYSHPFFVKGHSDLLEKIVRKNPRQTERMNKLKHQAEAEGSGITSETRESPIVSLGKASPQQEKKQIKYVEKIMEDVAGTYNYDVELLIKNYLNDDSDEEINQSSDCLIDFRRFEDPELLKKVKKTTAQDSDSAYYFRAQDFFKCQNLISALTNLDKAKSCNEKPLEKEDFNRMCDRDFTSEITLDEFSTAGGLSPEYSKFF